MTTSVNAVELGIVRKMIELKDKELRLQSIGMTPVIELRGKLKPGEPHLSLGKCVHMA